MNKNTIFPNAFVEYASVKSISQHVIMIEEKTFSSQSEAVYYLTHKVNNKKHSDGRIYMTIKDGLLYANSVSPYSDTFIDNIENGIKELVSTLISKRYLTYSSCEGHGNSFRRYVGLAFADIESRDYVAHYIKKLNIKGVIVKPLKTVVNQHSTLYNSPQYKEKFVSETLEQNEIDNFNIQFHRQYDNYTFLEIIILEEIPIGKFFWKKPLKNIWLLFMKKYFWDKQTAKLTQALKLPQFKKYKY